MRERRTLLVARGAWAGERWTAKSTNREIDTGITDSNGCDLIFILKGYGGDVCYGDPFTRPNRAQLAELGELAENCCALLWSRREPARRQRRGRREQLTQRNGATETNSRDRLMGQ